MASDSAQWLFERKFGCSSVALSFVEVAVIWGVVDLAQMIFGSTHLHPIVRVAIATWLFIGPASIAVAIAGLVADSHRSIALLALFISIAVFIVCGLRMLA